MVGVLTRAGGNAANAHGTVLAARPDGDVIGTDATVTVKAGRAGITAGRCPLRRATMTIGGAPECLDSMAIFR